MGFIFGYQNNNQFYIFDWKQGTQGYVGGTAIEGMSIKRIIGQVDFVEADFWWSDQDEAELDSQRGVITSFDSLGVVELRAVAIDSAEQVSEITSYIRVLDPTAPPTENPNQTVVAPPGQTTGDTTDRRPLVSFQAPLTTNDDPTRFIGTVDANGGSLDRWFFEWAPLANVDTSNLASPSVLWQSLAEDTTALDAAEIATIDPSTFPDEPIAFRLRARNLNGLGSMASVVFNPRTNATSGPSEETGTGDGTRATAAFTSPLDPSDDYTLLRGTVSANGGTLQSWTLEYAPRNHVNLDNLADPSVTWTALEQGTGEVEDGLLAALDPSILPDETFVFRLIAVNTSTLGSVATLIYNPVATSFSGPGDVTGPDSTTGERPVTRISSPTNPRHDRSSLIGSVLANGGTLENWMVDYAPYSGVNLNDLADPSVVWTSIKEGTDEVSNEALTPLTDAVFQNGVWVVRLRAFNTNGLGSMASTVLDTGDASVPDVAILSPDAEAAIGFVTEVRGTVSEGNGVLDFWKLELAPSEEVSLTNLNDTSANWVELGTGNSAVSDGVLGTLDPTSLRNGSYVLRLRAFNTNGRGLTDGRMVHVSGEAKLGNFRLEFDDLTVPLAGIPIRIQRIYDTLNANRSGDFGYGWGLGLGDPDIRETVPDTGDSYFFATPFEIGTRVFLTTPEGKRVGFTFNVRSPRNRFLFVDYEPYFEPDPGVYETLTIAPIDLERVEVDAEGAVYTPLLPFGYNPENYRLTTREGIVYNYNQRTGLQRITDRNGQSVTFSREGLTHASGERVIFERDIQGRITSITAPDGAEIAYRYDADGDLVEVVNELGDSTLLSYRLQPAHFLEKIANPEDASQGRFSRRIVYENGRVDRIEDGEGNVISRQAVNPGEFTGTQTDALGNVTELIYDALGNVVRQTSPGGAVTLLEYEDQVNPSKETAVIDPNGNRSEYTYESRGNLLSHTDPEGNSRAITYNIANQPTGLVVRDALGTTTFELNLVYDDAGNPQSFTDSLGRERRFTYDTQGRIIERVDFDGGVRTYDYGDDPRARYPAAITTGEDTIFITYNSRGNPIETRDNEGNTTHYSYDNRGQLIGRQNDTNQATQLQYNKDGKVTRITDPSGAISELVYDSDGRVSKEIKVLTDDGNDADDVVTEVGYDLAGNVISVVDAEGRRSTFEYNADGRRVADIDSLGRRQEYRYDGNGNPIEVTDRRGFKRVYAYDSLNRVTSETWLQPNTDEVVERFDYEYDDIPKLDCCGDRLIGLSDTTTSYAFDYDDRGLPVFFTNDGSADLPTVELTTTRDLNGRVTSIQDNHGVTVSRSYSSNGDMVSSAWQGGDLPGSSVKFELDRNGLVTGISRFSDPALSTLAASTRIGRDPIDGVIERIEHLSSSGSVMGDGFDFSFTRNAAQIITEQTILGDTMTFTYDGAGQLIGAAHSDESLVDEFYQYDAVGNRTDSHLGGAVTYNEAGLPAQDEQFAYEYDEENNLVSQRDLTTGTVRTFIYDHRNRMVALRENNDEGALVSETTLRYDPMDRVVGRTVNGVTTYTAYEGVNPWIDFNSDGEVIARYFHDETVDGMLARWTPGGGVQWLLTDQVRSVRGITDHSGNVLASIHYDSFGNAIEGAEHLSDLRFGFTGRELIGEGLYHFRSRLLSTTHGRFLSEDRLGLSAGDPNLTRYVFNNPLNLIDPLGTTSITEVNFAAAEGVKVQMVTVSVSTAILTQALVGAIVTPILDMLCLWVSGQSDRISAVRAARHFLLGGAQGAVIGGLGVGLGALSYGRVVFNSPAGTRFEQGFFFLGGKLSNLIGSWIAYLDKVTVPTIALVIGGITTTASTAGQRFDLGGADCDSIFYNMIFSD